MLPLLPSRVSSVLTVGDVILPGFAGRTRHTKIVVNESSGSVSASDVFSLDTLQKHAEQLARTVTEDTIKLCVNAVNQRMLTAPETPKMEDHLDLRHLPSSRLALRLDTTNAVAVM